MTSAIDWSPVFPAAPLIFSGVVILAALLYMEWKRRQRFLTIRITCQVLIVVSVLGLLLRPSFRFPASSGPAVLLTAGFNPNDVDSLLALHRDLSIITTNDSIDYHRAVKRLDIGDLGSLAANPLWISGEGLPAYALQALPVKFHFLPPKSPPDGIVALTYNKPVVTATRNAIAITYHNPTAEIRTVRLAGPGGIEDSVSVQASGEVGLSLELIPRVDGRTMYRIEETDSAGNVFRTSRLPIYVEKMKSLDVLIVTDHPSFEVRYLKNFLADRGHRVAFRSRVSKDRFHQEFANRPREALNSLTSELLSSTDVLLVDHATYLSLSAMERDRIHRSADEGLGVVFLAPEATSNGRLLAFKRTSGPDTARVAAADGHFVLPLTSSAPVSDVVPVITADNGQTVSGCRCTAGMKVGYQLLNETYQLGLQNKTAAYAALWTPLIDRVGRIRQSELSISPEPEFPVFSDVPANVRIISSGTTPRLIYDSMLLPLAEDVRIDDVWHGRLWAAGNRWHSIRADSATFHFFDLPDTEWKALRVAHQINANRSYTFHGEALASHETSRPMPLIFFVLFVIASGTLWLIPKI